MRYAVSLFVMLALFAGDFSAASVTSITTFSPSNNRNVSFSIYLPPNYPSPGASATRYPVVYSLHGIGGVPSQRAAMAAPTLDSLINAQQVPAMIWVFPD